MSILTNGHLSEDLIYRTLDDELLEAESLECETHLATCEACRLQLAAVHELSMAIETVVHAAPVPSMTTLRGSIQKKIEANHSTARGAQTPGRVLRRFGWGIAIAASLAIGVLVAPKSGVWVDSNQHGADVRGSVATRAANIEVDGESFLPLPYSNADLQTASPHIVQMQVPVSSLAEVGIMLEPVSNTAVNSDAERSVLADVLVGADGQPQGVHVLGFE